MVENRAEEFMCLSIIWYHAGLMPGWEKTLDELDKKVTSFIWKGTLPKVARATLLPPKEYMFVVSARHT